MKKPDRPIPIGLSRTMEGVHMPGTLIARDSNLMGWVCPRCGKKYQADGKAVWVPETESTEGFPFICISPPCAWKGRVESGYWKRV